MKPETTLFGPFGTNFKERGIIVRNPRDVIHVESVRNAIQGIARSYIQAGSRLGKTASLKKIAPSTVLRWKQRFHTL